MTKHIKITLEQLDEFLNGYMVFDEIKRKALYSCKSVLENSLTNKVFTNHSDTKKIVSKDHLRTLIKGGSNHKPAPAPKGNTYNQEYLDKKRNIAGKHGVYSPHVFTEHGFWNNIRIVGSNDQLTMSIIEPKMHRGFDYLTHHENNRSVLKRAFHEAWKGIIDKIVEVYIKEIREL